MSSDSLVDEIRDLDVVTLTRDLPSEGVARGQIGAVVFVHNDGEAFEVEFVLEPARSVVATVMRGDLIKLKGLGLSKASS